MKKEQPLEEQLDSAYSTISRFATENTHLRSDLRKHYEARRRLENAIRRHVTKQCGCHSHTACIVALGKLVPKYERVAYKKRHSTKSVEGRSAT